MSHLPPPSEPEIRAERESLGDMVASLSANLSELFRKEVELAKAELTESAKQAGKGAGLFGGAGIAGHMALLFLSLTVMFALGTFMDLVWAALIVTLIWAAAAGILALVGKSEIEKVQGAPQTTETLAEIPDTLKPTPEARR